jgi:hypothetical protein
MFSWTELARNMDPILASALSEHLIWTAEHPESFPHSENISQSQAAWFMAQNEILALEQKFTKRLYEWYAKWQQRFKIEGTAQIVAEGAKEIRAAKNHKERERLTKILYTNAIHDLVSDVEKYIVTMNGNMNSLQKDIREIWHKNCFNNSWFKILPSMESALQNYEESYFDNIRKSLPDIARQNLLSIIMANANYNLILNFYFSKMYLYASKISRGFCKFYSKKWALYARGFSSRQNLLPLG